MNTLSTLITISFGHKPKIWQGTEANISLMFITHDFHVVYCDLEVQSWLSNFDRCHIQCLVIT